MSPIKIVAHTHTHTLGWSVVLVWVFVLHMWRDINACHVRCLFSVSCIRKDFPKENKKIGKWQGASSRAKNYATQCAQIAQSNYQAPSAVKSPLPAVPNPRQLRQSIIMLACKLHNCSKGSIGGENSGIRLMGRGRIATARNLKTCATRKIIF